ncbi:hypothetical protein ACHAPA_010539 [Fusarium lateritium]
MSSTKQRRIDALPPKEDALEMEVLVLGMPRTGSISMRHAMSKLGYKVFHGGVLEANPQRFPYWEEALVGKYFGGKPFGRPEFEKVLGEFNASVNFPATMWAEELLKAYPNAKVILTTRDVDKWLFSMKQSVDASFIWFAMTFNWLAPFDPIWGPWWRFHKLGHKIRPIQAPRGERIGFLEHYELMKELVPRERLLEYRVGEGWERLCTFLDKPVPAEPFPHVNNLDSFLADRNKRWWHAFNCMLVRVLPPTAVVVAVVAAAWKYRPIPLSF